MGKFLRYATIDEAIEHFEAYWEDLSFTSYQLHTLDNYLNQEIYRLAKKLGWIPKALRKGKQKKRPPLKTIMQEVAEELKASDTFVLPITISISLVIDTFDVWKYLKGETAFE